MSADNVGAEHRRKRIKRLKKCIALLRAVVIILPLAVCACVLVEVYNLRKTMEDMSAQVDRLASDTARQQEAQEQLVGKMQIIEQKADAAGTALRHDKPSGITDPVQGEDPDIQEPEVTAAHKVYLTFDDGPSIYTQEILNILDSYDVKATFFVLGKENDSMKERLRSIAEAGHTLAMHSYSHNYSDVYESVASFSEDLAKIQSYIYDETGVWSTIYRFPGGSSNKLSKVPMETYAKYLDGQGIVFYDWNSSSGDGGAALLPVETLVENSMKGILKRDTTVILMHDSASKKTTVEALPILIQKILALEDTVILPITESTKPIQHIKWSPDPEEY